MRSGKVTHLKLRPPDSLQPVASAFSQFLLTIEPRALRLHSKLKCSVNQAPEKILVGFLR